MSSCVFPGTFNPVTRGHMDLIRRASRIFDRVTVTVMVNIHKTTGADAQQRMKLLEQACAGLENVRVDKWEGLLSEYMRLNGEHCVIRGVRDGTEFDTEMAASRANRQLNPEMETVLLPADPRFSWLSSSAVREMAAFGADIGPYVPEGLEEEIRQSLR